MYRAQPTNGRLYEMHRAQPTNGRLYEMHRAQPTNGRLYFRLGGKHHAGHRRGAGAPARLKSGHARRADRWSAALRAVVESSRPTVGSTGCIGRSRPTVGSTSDLAVSTTQATDAVLARLHG